MKFSFLFFASSSSFLCANAFPGPEIDVSARVKQHRSGAGGDLVEGEEELRKVIVTWDKAYGASSYEICHNCVLNASGDLIEGVAQSANSECGAQPCSVHPAAPLGYNTFQVRAKTGAGWSEWGTQRKFFVDEVGHVDHEEL